tara:strand:- start:265 stop:981 length:717 start_codon:yes stop_codon:yes gene_type:complete
MSKNRFITSAKKSGAGTVRDKELTVIIPAAGMGHRMKSYGPKCLLPLNHEDVIITKIINDTKNLFPFSEIITVVGFEADKIIKVLPKQARVIENQLYDQTNIVESLRLAINNSIHDRILIIYGDLIFNPKSIKDITKDGSCILVDSQGRFKEESVGVTVIDGVVTNFSYGLETKWAQIIYLEGKELETFKSLCLDRKRNKMYPFELFNTMLNRGAKIKALEPEGMSIREINSLRDLEQ